jgi:hypothetical protein
MALSDALLPWLAAQCPGIEPDRIATAMAEWLERQENEPWLSPAYRITARLLRDELNTQTTEELS